MEFPFPSFFSCRKRKLDFIVLLYAIFSSIHQKIFFETRNFIFEVKYLHKYVQRCSFLLKLQASCVRAVQNFFCSKLLQKYSIQVSGTYFQVLFWWLLLHFGLKRYKWIAPRINQSIKIKHEYNKIIASLQNF